MCKVSDQLKLCSCKTDVVEKLKHYWILKRHNGGNTNVIGEAILPQNSFETADKINFTTIAKMLNSGNCFEIELQHQKNDILELHFTYFSKLRDWLLPMLMSGQVSLGKAYKELDEVLSMAAEEGEDRYKKK